MNNLSPRVRSLLRRARRNAEQNRLAAAETLFRQITEEAPEVAAGWVGLADVLGDTEARLAALEEALRLEPENREALQALAGLQGASLSEAGTDPGQANGREVTTTGGRAVAEVPEDAGAPPEAGAPAAAQSPERTDTVARQAPSVDAAGPESESGLASLDRAGLDDARDWHQKGTVTHRFGDAQPAEASGAEHRHEAIGPDQTDEAPIVCCSRMPAGGTSLRCFRCGKPICGNCSQQTPVGRLCLACVREAEAAFFTAEAVHYLKAAAVTVFLGALAAFLMSLIGFWFVAIFLGSGVGALIGRAAFWATGRRRGRYLAVMVAGLVILTALPFLLVNLLGVGLYLFFATSASYYQLR